MIQFVEQRARDKGLDTLLVLSTQAFNYFRSKAGFAEGTPDDLPKARREQYDRSARNSKVLLKPLRAESLCVVARPEGVEQQRPAPRDAHRQ